MALIFDRVKESTTTTGTGDITLSGAETGGFQTFSAVLSDGQQPYYCIQDTTNSAWEVGIGTFHSGTNTLTRTTVLASSNSGSAVNFAAGTKDIFITYPAGRAVLTDVANTFTQQQTVLDLSVSGLTGATAASRYVGATASGAPGSGTFALGDYVIDQTGTIRICTTAGSPGTWTQAGALSSVSNSDGTLTISPTTGAVVASLALGHANTWTGLQTFEISDSATTTVTNISQLYHASSGTPAAGFGGSQILYLDSATVADRATLELDWTWATATDASRKPRVIWKLTDGSAGQQEALRIETDGTLAILGVCGTTTASTMLTVHPGADSYVGLNITANSATQSGGLQIWQNSAATSVTKLTGSTTGDANKITCNSSNYLMLESTASATIQFTTNQATSNQGCQIYNGSNDLCDLVMKTSGNDVGGFRLENRTTKGFLSKPYFSFWSGSFTSSIPGDFSSAANGVLIYGSNPNNSARCGFYTNFAGNGFVRMGELQWDSPNTTFATRTNRLKILTTDTADRECARFSTSGTAPEISFFGATEVVQQNTTGTTSGYTDSGATVVHTAGTFTGGTGSTAYTIGDIVLALKNYGLLAA